MLSKDLILVDKPYGATPLETIQALRLSGVLGPLEKATYAGRLDPLATGLLLVLRGEGVHEKEQYLGLSKTYEIEFAFGVETDTGDLLGIPQAGNSQVVPSLQDIITCLESITEIPYPHYSSKTVGGKPLHEYAREGMQISRPSRPAQYRITHSASPEPLASIELKTQAQHACKIVKGDFRQSIIHQAWSDIELSQTLTRYAFTIDVISGTYIRAIPEIIRNAFGVASVITKIHRTRVGDFTI